MHLYDLPIIAVLIGLALYTILGGADFGAGIWQLVSLLTPASSAEGRGRSRAIREHAHHAIGPVWEANHVWLIFVLTVTWTAYPAAFGALASTLAVPLLFAGVGIIFRGTAYALRSGTAQRRELRIIDGLFSAASFLTPFALGTMVGAIASGRVPKGNAAGNLISSWLNPTSLLAGALAVVLSAYLAAVYLAADADRHDETELAGAFRRRALVTAVIAGAIALAGLPVLHADAHRLYVGLLEGPGLVGVGISLLAGVTTLGLVLARRYGQARISAALAVVGMIVGWALAQQPRLLPDLTVAQAAAPTTTLIAVLIAIGMGIVILFPSLGLLFGLFLRGGFDDQPLAVILAVPTDGGRTRSATVSVRVAIAGLLGGLGFLTFANPPWAHTIGVISLGVCALATLAAVNPTELADLEGASITESPSPPGA
ncbi:cytochrome d ubiquinol oxidase subunit II [Conexibacter sp. DBS9H8]|uniref:cytochrome d ubiquinol oxidase subunit II n=1 Tax=Conexibacter sp. DBS9H8 TaxID=2937801 RepID=UPI00200D511E|nr:cytochrome d ubiquinol oxidase subunit II [Conexibacter sp. DBS9H8]